MENIYLVGSEDVRSAANTISGAASEMSNAAASMDSTVDRLSQIMEDFLIRFEEIMEKNK